MDFSDIIFFATLCIVWFYAVVLGRKYDRRTFVVAAVVLTVAYFGMSAMFLAIDLNGWFSSRKIQHDACTPPNEYFLAFVRVSLIFAFVLVPTLYVFWVLIMPRRRALGYAVETPGIVAFALGTVLLLVSADVMAWTIHRGMHYFTFIYDHIHVYHHQHIAPVAVAALDAHPIEVFAWDLLPFMVGPLILGAPPTLTLFSALLAITQTVSAHSGYSLGAISDGTFHDLHHERMKCNYGGNFMMDRICGTYIAREKDRVYPRWNQTEKSLAGSRNVWCSLSEATSPVRLRMHPEAHHPA